MRAYDIIAKKRDGQTLTYQEIEFMIDNYISEKIPDYQMSAFLMSIYLRGMTEQETCDLTKIMLNFGEMTSIAQAA